MHNTFYYESCSYYVIFYYNLLQKSLKLFAKKDKNVKLYLKNYLK